MTINRLVSALGASGTDRNAYVGKSKHARCWRGISWLRRDIDTVGRSYDTVKDGEETKTRRDKQKTRENGRV